MQVTCLIGGRAERLKVRAGVQQRSLRTAGPQISTIPSRGFQAVLTRTAAQPGLKLVDCAGLHDQYDRLATGDVPAVQGFSMLCLAQVFTSAAILVDSGARKSRVTHQL